MKPCRRQRSVQAEIKSYSSVVASNTSTPPAFSFTPDVLKKAVRTAIVEEDRSKNLLVYGLAENEGENLERTACELFLELGEKPRIHAINRIGRKGAGVNSDQCRPVKVTLASGTSVSQILTRTGRLKDTAQYNKVYVCPDRSFNERAVRKQLVSEMKKAAKKKPHLYHCIRGGKICSKEKTDT